MLNSQEVADYFLFLADDEVGDAISNLKLQKLCYYAQGINLALYGSPLFDDPIQAWKHGPVIPVLYDAYKKNECNAIALLESIDLEKYNNQEQDLLDEVYQVFGQFSAWKLRDMTHNEKPWLEARDKGYNTVINLDTMKKYFKTQLINAD